MEMLDLLFDKAKEEFYIVANDKEVMTENGKFISISSLNNNLINLGSIHNKPKVSILFK